MPPILGTLPFLAQYHAWWESLPPQVRVACLTVVALWLIGFAIFVIHVLRAPYGYEDERGFHPGKTGDKNHALDKSLPR